MIGIIMIVIAGLTFGLGLTTGYLVRPRREVQLEKRLAKTIQKIQDVQSLAASHIALGDPFAAIVFDELNKKENTP